MCIISILMCIYIISQEKESPLFYRNPVLGVGTANFIIKPTIPLSEGSGSLICLEVCNMLFGEGHSS